MFARERGEVGGRWWGWVGSTQKAARLRGLGVARLAPPAPEERGRLLESLQREMEAEGDGWMRDAHQPMTMDVCPSTFSTGGGGAGDAGMCDGGRQQQPGSHALRRHDRLAFPPEEQPPQPPPSRWFATEERGGATYAMEAPAAYWPGRTRWGEAEWEAEGARERHGHLSGPASAQHCNPGHPTLRPRRDATAPSAPHQPGDAFAQPPPPMARSTLVRAATATVAPTRFAYGTAEEERRVPSMNRTTFPLRHVAVPANLRSSASSLEGLGEGLDGGRATPPPLLTGGGDARQQSPVASPVSVASTSSSQQPTQQQQHQEQQQHRLVTSPRRSGVSLEGVEDAFRKLEEVQQRRLLFTLLRQCHVANLQWVNLLVQPNLKLDILRALPRALARRCLLHLDLTSLGRAIAVSQSWYRLLEEDVALWRQLAHRHAFVQGGLYAQFCELRQQHLLWQQQQRPPPPARAPVWPDSPLDLVTPSTGYVTHSPHHADHFTHSPHHADHFTHSPHHADHFTHSPHHDDHLPMRPIVTSQQPRFEEMHGDAMDLDVDSSVREGPGGDAPHQKRPVTYPRRARSTTAASLHHHHQRRASTGLLYCGPQPAPYSHTAAPTARAPWEVDPFRNPVTWKTFFRRMWTLSQNWKLGRSRSHSFAGHSTGALTCLQFDERVLVTASDDYTVKAWDARSGAFLRCFKGHRGGVWAMQYVGDHLVTGATDKYAYRLMAIGLTSPHIELSSFGA